MATILEFIGRPADPADEKEVKAPDGSTAQIIFFPGIRIERYDIDPFLEDDVEVTQHDAAKSSKA